MPKGGKREGAGRKPTPKPNKVRTSLTLNIWVNDWLGKQAKINSLSKSELVEKIIISFRDSQE